MTLETLTLQLRGLEAQLAMVKAQLEQMRPAKASTSFRSLYGIHRNFGPVSEEEINASLYRLPPDEDNL